MKELKTKSLSAQKNARFSEVERSPKMPKVCGSNPSEKLSGFRPLDQLGGDLVYSSGEN